MKTKILLVLSFALAAFSAQAAPLTVQQEVSLYDAITALDQGGVKNVDGKAAAYQFDFSAHTRIALSRNLVLVQPAQAAIAKVRAQKVLEFTGGKPADDKDASLNAKVELAIRAELEKDDPKSPKLEMISEADLKLDTNIIPFKTQAGLAPIIGP